MDVKRADLLAEEAVGVRVPHQVRVLLLAQVGRRAQPAVALDVDLVRGGRRPVAVEEVEESGVREEWESGRAGGTRSKLACNSPSHRRLPLLRHCDDLKLLRVREEVDPAVLRPRVLH